MASTHNIVLNINTKDWFVCIPNGKHFNLTFPNSQYKTKSKSDNSYWTSKTFYPWPFYCIGPLHQFLSEQDINIVIYRPTDWGSSASTTQWRWKYVHYWEMLRNGGIFETRISDRSCILIRSAQYTKQYDERECEDWNVSQARPIAILIFNFSCSLWSWPNKYFRDSRTFLWCPTRDYYRAEQWSPKYRTKIYPTTRRLNMQWNVLIFPGSFVSALLFWCLNVRNTHHGFDFISNQKWNRL